MTEMIEQISAAIQSSSPIIGGPLCDAVRARVELSSKSLIDELAIEGGDALVRFFLKWIREQANERSVDMPSLNAALNLISGRILRNINVDRRLLSELRQEIDTVLHRVECGEMTISHASSERNEVSRFALPSSRNQGVVIIVPGLYSVVAAYTVEMLLLLGVQIDAVIVSKSSPFSIGASGLSGSRLKTVKRKLFFACRKLLRYVYKPRGYIDIRSVVKKTGTGKSGLIALCEHNNIPINTFSSINDNEAVAYLKKLHPVYGVYLSPEIMRENAISCFSGGVIHSHPGIIPDYKGMDSVDWAVLQGDYQRIGYSVQLLGAALDNGKLIKREALNDISGMDVQTIRSRVLYFSIEDTARIAAELVQNGGEAFQLGGDQGRQYFFMRPELRRLLKRQVKRGVEHAEG